VLNLIQDISWLLHIIGFAQKQQKARKTQEFIDKKAPNIGGVGGWLMSATWVWRGNSSDEACHLHISLLLIWLDLLSAQSLAFSTSDCFLCCVLCVVFVPW
jgi:hypothetical protein